VDSLNAYPEVSSLVVKENHTYKSFQWKLMNKPFWLLVTIKRFEQIQQKLSKTLFCLIIEQLIQ
jgi:hypothetical protein